MYRYLVHHSHVLPCKLKEPQFFNQGREIVERDFEQYLQLFPPRQYQGDLRFEWPELNKQGILYHEEVYVKRDPDRTYITGEASANTFREVAPELLNKYFPHARLILLLRNPADRAFSLHRMYQRFQAEGRPLPFPVRDFETDISAALYQGSATLKALYLDSGIYLERLRAWRNLFGKDQLKIYFTEEMEAPGRMAGILEEVQDYLGLPHFDYGEFLEKKFNRAPVASMKAECRAMLCDFFNPHNEALSQYLNRQLPWSCIQD